MFKSHLLYVYKPSLKNIWIIIKRIQTNFIQNLFQPCQNKLLKNLKKKTRKWHVVIIKSKHLFYIFKYTLLFKLWPFKHFFNLNCPNLNSLASQFYTYEDLRMIKYKSYAIQASLKFLKQLSMIYGSLVFSQ